MSTSVAPASAPAPLLDSVTPATLLAHLRLLRLVQSLVIVEDEDLDFLFLIRSEERYLLYMDMLQHRQPSPATIPLPPLGRSVDLLPLLSRNLRRERTGRKG